MSIFDLRKFACFTLGLTLALFILSVDGFAQNSTQQLAGPPESSLSTDYREPRSAIFSDANLIIKADKKYSYTPPIPVTELVPPSFEERDLIWKEKRSLAVKTNMKSPSPAEKYLLSEIKILGLYEKTEGQGVFLKPTLAMSTTIFAMVGQDFWDGKITKINKDSIEVQKKVLLTSGKSKTEIQTIPFTRGK